MSTEEEFIIPAGEVARVSIVDSTSSISGLPVSYLMKPPMAGFEKMNDLPTLVFLVESTTGKKALYDLGIRPDWENFAPAVVTKLKKAGWDVRAEKNVVDILRENGVKADEIQSVIWSHWHWDHLGDPSTFPSSTELVVGPGFKDAILPGYPKNEAANVLESDFEGRTLREIDFKSSSSSGSELRIGSFQAFDFFGDGSFYLLDTPGHAVGHLAGLARTTKNPDTFIFMGGDLCHHGGEIRPSRLMPLPQSITPHPFSGSFSVPCPGALFEDLAQSRDCDETGSFFLPAMGHDIPQAISTIRKAQVADVREDILFIYAHDTHVRKVVDLFPLGTANDWKAKGWGEKLRWAFLKDFELAV